VKVARLAIAALSLVIVGACAPPPSIAPVPATPPPATTPETETRPVVPPPPQPAPYGFDHEPSVDVGLRWDIESFAIEPLEDVALERQGPTGIETVGRTAGPVQATLRASRFAVSWSGGSVALGPADTLWIGGDPKMPDGAARLRWSGRTWRGVFKIFISPRGKLSLATRLPLEAYLLGVVPGEIGALSEDLIEAGRAQAIAARSYTLFYAGRRWVKEGFDVYATVEDQVYGPVESEAPLASRCVTSTRAEVALYDHQPIRANYSSTCGGISADVWESWPADPLPYLKSRPDRDDGADYCAASRHYRWIERYSVEEFTHNLRRFAPERGVPLPKGGVGELLDVRVAGRSHSGRVWRLEVLTSTGRIVIPGQELRWVLRRAGMPGSILRSTLIKVAVRRDPATRAAREVVVTGGGSGHGVGLCQTGALGMARTGHSAAEILEHYYTGIEVRPAY
jgi:SpoIID/LytB domain protein